MPSPLTLACDQHGQVPNTDVAHDAIVDALTNMGGVAFSWIDGLGTRMTICMTIPARYGYLPGLAMLRGYLYVGIEGYGCHPFLIADEEIAADYVGEKLMSGRCNATTTELAKLISAVRKGLVHV